METSNNRNQLEYMQPRKSLRLPGYDYRSSGAYFITICTRNRQPFFNIPILRIILEEQWEVLPAHFVGVKTDTYTIMSNHIHGILWIDAQTPHPPTLMSLIGGYKSLVSGTWFRHVKINHIDYSGPLWQRGYYDHIIRNDKDLQTKRTYILNNPILETLKNET